MTRRHAAASAAGLVAGILVLAGLGADTAAEADPREEPAAPPAAASPEHPLPTDLRERTARRLAQLDVTVEGPEEVVRTLTADDFELVVNGRPITSFVVDRLCTDPAPAARDRAAARPRDEAPGEPASAGPQVTPPRPTTTFLVYFDQHHLTAAGRQNALDIAAELLPELVAAGHRVMIVSAADRVATVSELTNDADALLAALERLENDRSQWAGMRAFEEELRIREVVDILDEGDIARALSVARRYSREEGWRTDRALRRLGMVLGRLADVEPPKALIYFADTMRRNAGEHYLSFFGNSVRSDDSAESDTGLHIQTDALRAGLPFEHVIDGAAGHGVRVYSVQAEGLQSDSSLMHASTSLSAGAPSSSNPNQQRIRDAQDSLVGLSRETGGEAFLNGVQATRIARRILDDLRCIYLLSFDAEGLPLDSALPVLVRVERPKVKADVRGRLVIQSDEARLTSRLLAAFGDAPEAGKAFPVSSVVIPTGFAEGRYSALVQVRAPGSPLSGTVWDLGASLVSRGEVREDVSGRLEISGPGVAVVLEEEMTFRPGPYEIVAVAHERTGDQLGTSRLDGEWPDPDGAPVTIGPIAVIQPRQAAFLRDEKSRRKGAYALAESEPVATDLPTLFVGLVCRSGAAGRVLRLERTLAGDDEAPFAPQEITFGDERCARFQDKVRAGTMTTGLFHYRVRVLDGEQERAAAEREFPALDPAEREAMLSGS